MSQLCLPNPNPELSELITRYWTFVRVGDSNHGLTPVTIEEKQTLVFFYIRFRDSMYELLEGVTCTPWRHPAVRRAQMAIDCLFSEVRSARYENSTTTTSI